MTKQISDKQDPRRLWGIAAVAIVGVTAVILNQCGSKQPESAPAALKSSRDFTLGQTENQMMELIRDFRGEEPTTFKNVVRIIETQGATAVSLRKTIAAVSQTGNSARNGNSDLTRVRLRLLSALQNIQLDTGTPSHYLPYNRALLLFPIEAKKPAPPMRFANPIDSDPTFGKNPKDFPFLLKQFRAADPAAFQQMVEVVNSDAKPGETYRKLMEIADASAREKHHKNPQMKYPDLAYSTHLVSVALMRYRGEWRERNGFPQNEDNIDKLGIFEFIRIESQKSVQSVLPNTQFITQRAARSRTAMPITGMLG